MQCSHAGPWDFYNGDPQFFSPSGRGVIEYGKLSEIAMGGPLVGDCYLLSGIGKYRIAEYCGGPPLWEKSGERCAIPIWVRHWWKGWVQRLAIADTTSRKLVLLKPLYQVLHIKKFEGNLVEGIDSPIHRQKTFQVDITKEKIFNVTQLLSCP